MTATLTYDDMLALWKSSTDEGYWRPLLENPDSGVESVEQSLSQHARASEMVTRSTQAMFILPWSGQTDEPASGGVNATVDLRFTRTDRFNVFVMLPATLPVDHYPEDYSTDGTINVLTGRKYFLADDAFLLPGEAGPLDVTAVAEKIGHNYNLPLPDSITHFGQIGGGLTNDEGTVLASGVRSVLRLDVEPDVIGPMQVGQLVEFVSGANVGEVRLVVGYSPAIDTVHGGDIQLDAMMIFEATISGTPVVGESIEQGAARATYVLERGGFVVADNDAAVAFAPGVATFTTSGATLTITNVARGAYLVNELATAEWKVLSWADDLGLAVTNPESPQGGRSAMLDELGGERGVNRSPNESDDSYRMRVANVADKVSPNAIRRAANDALAPWGITACLREIGSDLFFGFFFDAASSSDPDPDRSFAYDVPDTNPLDRYKLVMDLVNARAFFLITLQVMPLGEFGFPYDDAVFATNFFDLTGDDLDFYDGAPIGAGDVYGTVWNAVDQTRAGGVGFDLAIDNDGC